jgi:hypothetical protein
VAWVALWRAFHQTRKCSFLMISPKLLDISPFFLLIFSPLGTADFLILLRLPGDGFSLLCSKKQPPRHTSVDVMEKSSVKVSLSEESLPNEMRNLFNYCQKVCTTNLPNLKALREGVQHGKSVLEGGEGGEQQRYLLMQLTTRSESSMVRLFLRMEREENNSFTC